ncbi:unnamed protein product [Closterium sp. Naga37s-1]|nr:unnamed protein product [Closterium sp. Naga37s-1]
MAKGGPFAPLDGARSPFSLLVFASICTAFTGLQDVFLAAWLQQLLTLRFFSAARVGDRSWRDVVALTVVVIATQACGTTVAYGNYALSLAANIVASCHVAVANVLPCLADSLFRFTYRRSPHLHPLVFPLVSASIWSFLSLLSPFGALAHPFYSLCTLLPLVQATSFVGMDGVLLLVGWLVAGIHQMMCEGDAAGMGEEGWSRGRRGGGSGGEVGEEGGGRGEEHMRFYQQLVGAPIMPSVPVSCIILQAPTEAIPPRDPESIHLLSAAANASTSLPTLSALKGYGGEGEKCRGQGECQQGRNGDAEGAVYAAAVGEGATGRAKTADGVGEAAAPAKGTWEEWEARRVSGIARVMQQTQQRASAGDALILWSEATIILLYDHEEDKLLADLSALAIAARANRTAAAAGDAAASPVLGPYLGVSYVKLITFVPEIFINTFVLIDPSGAHILHYNKSHLFPSVEADVLPGSGSLPVVDTELGRMSVAVCLDMQFPALIRQAGRQGVDILLEPSWSWGATGHLLSDGDAVRAAENGLTLLRCCSVGVSGVVSPHYRTLAAREGLSSGTLSMNLPRLPHAPALYPFIGLPISLLLLSLTLLATFLAVCPALLKFLFVTPPCSLLPHPLWLAGQQGEGEREKGQSSGEGIDSDT